eukprot:g7478.t1
MASAMKDLSASRRSSVNELCSFVGASEVESIAVLSKFNWNLAEAADAFFSGDVDVAQLVAASRPMPPAPPAVDPRKLDEWFNRYADGDEKDSILDEGIERFYTELGVDTQDLVVLIISWKMEAEEMCVYSRGEWQRAMSKLGVSSTRQLRQQLDALRGEVADRRSETFREFYMFCFDYAKERGKKSIELEVCLPVWDLVLSGPEFPLLKDFSDFLRGANVPVVTKDMWAQTLAFFCQVDADLSNFDESDAWPVVVDEFVEKMLAQKKASTAPSLLESGYLGLLRQAPGDREGSGGVERSAGARQRYMVVCVGGNPTLLGLEAVATLTSLNFLILHHRDGGVGLCDQEGKSGGDGGRARLALGHRCWDICGIGKWGPSMDTAMQRQGSGRRGLVADQHRLEREIENVVKIVSRSEVIPTDPTPTATQRENKPTGGASIRSAAGQARRNLRRLRARTRAAGALALSPAASSFAPTSNTITITATTISPSSPLPRSNPLMRVGMGALVSSRVCNTILREAQESEAWAPWDGDLGTGAVATSLEDLPRSRTLWAGKVGAGVRTRIAGLYGVPVSSIIVDASGVFACKFGADGGDGDGRDGRGETKQCGAKRRPTIGERKKRIDGPEMQQQHHHHHMVTSTSAAEFRRSKSLVTFCVALGGEEGAGPSWAVCLEQRRECIRLSSQGSGVIFSGKLRHASVRTYTEAGGAGELSTDDGEDTLALQHPPVVLRGFASIHHPSVLPESARWQWGSPAWHVDAPWIKDQDILDRVWMESGSHLAPKATGPSTAADEATASAVEFPGSCYLERMNSTLAHRYYRQGVGGMDVPVVDPLGRPVVDLLVDSGPFLLSRLRGVVSDEADMFTVRAVLRGRFLWDRRRRQVGKAGFSTQAGASPRMDAALQELFGEGSAGSVAGGDRESFVGVPVPPIKYVFVDPRYRGLGLGRRLFLEAMRSLARRGFRFALIVVEDNGGGGLFGFYEDMGFVRAEEQLGLPRAMIARIPPPEGR